MKMTYVKFSGFCNTEEYDRRVNQNDALPAWGILGGWFENGSWDTYIGSWTEPMHQYLEALRWWVIANDVRRTGCEAQRLGLTVALFDDDCALSFSWRGWGDFMAAVWSTEDGKRYTYMDFYM